MTTVDTITPAVCRAITTEAADALASVAERYGLTVKVRAGSYDRTSFTFKVEMATEDAARLTYEADAPLLGLPADSFGKTITIRKRPMTIVGLNLRARTMPVLVRDADGREFKTDPATVLRKLAVRS